MALPAYDNFNRSTGIGANWTGSIGGDLAIASDTKAKGVTSSADNSMYWSADAPNADQYAQSVLLSAAGWSGPFVHGGATDWVMLDAAWQDATKNVKLEWYNSGSFTTIGSAYNVTPAVNDVLKVTVVSGTFKGYLNTVERCSGTNASAPTTGYGGLYIYGDALYLDDFEVGNLGGAVYVGPRPRVLVPKSQRRRSRRWDW